MKLITLLAFLLVVHQVNCQTPVFRNFTMKDGLSSNVTYDIIQDSKGFLWVATENGICRFDGKEFKNFTIKDGLADNEVFKIREDTKGRIWFLSYNGRLSFFKNGIIFNQKNYPLLEKFSFNYLIRELFEDKDGNIWASSQEEGLKCLKPDNTIHSFYSTDGKYDQISGIYYADDKLIAESSNYKYVIQDFVLSTIKKSSTTFISDNSIEKAILYHNNSSFKSRKDTFFLDTGDKQIYDVLIDRNNALWVATNEGLVLSDNEIISDYLSDNTITSVLQDHEGNIWFSTLGEGIFMKPVMSFYSLISPEEQVSSSIFSLDLAGDSLVAGTSEGSFLLISLKNKSVKEFFLESHARSNKVRTIHIDKRGRVWCGTDAGVFVANQKKVVFLKKSFPVKSFAVNPSGELYFASTSGIIKVNLHRQDVVQISGKRTTAIAFSGDILLAGSLNGIIEKAGKYSFLKNERITTISSDEDLEFFGTYGNGIFIRTDTSVLHLSEKDYLPGNVIKGFTKSGPKIYWIATNKGLSRIALSPNAPKHISAVNFTGNHGLPSEDIRAIQVSDRTVFFASDKGITSFIASPLSKEESVPKIYITETYINNQPVKFPQQNPLKSDQNNIRFEFTAVSLSSLGDVQYEFLLEGVDKTWSTAFRNFADYRNLKPGRYNFYVRAISKFGFTSEPEKVSFHIEPHFTDSIIFQSALSFVVLSLLYMAGLVIWKNQKKKHEQNIRLLKLEQHALASQMNPHFIFNCLNSIQQFILTSDKLAANKYLTSFAGLIRSFLENGKRSMINLEEELKTLQLYCQLENLRVNNRLEIRIHKPDSDLTNFYIPSMLIQPLVENSILHGLIPLDASIRNPRLDITVQTSNDLVEITIKDNGIGRKKSLGLHAVKAGHNSTAIRNIMERLRILNEMKGFRGDFSIEDLFDDAGQPAGTLARIRLQMKIDAKATNGNY